VDEAGKTAQLLEAAGSAETEAWLEDVLVQNPAMLMPGLKLVGRQTPTANGYLDLLGVDSDGRLVVFELKREKLRREAVAQAVDYASWLDSLDDAELHRLIGDNSGRAGIPEIGNFEEWYESNDNWDSLESLRPLRIVLVGLGADEPARRMADWLARKGVEIDLLTFLGYRHGERMLLARQLDHSDETRKQQKQARIPRAEKNAIRLDAIDRKVEEYGMRDWWPDAVAMLERNSKPSYRANLGITFYKRRARTLSTGFRAAGSHKIEIIEPGLARVIFFPAAVDLCLDEFEALKPVIPFDLEPLSNAPPTEQVPEQWFCRLDERGWRKHKDSIEELVRMVDERWREAAEQPPP
jgi:hypothetical protein